LPDIQRGERQNKTVMEAFPDSFAADCYRNLAAGLLEACHGG